ncbi:MAG: S41 family peptidase [Chitinispirillia bacterium]|nr:S41 family peptidase [Chitinispirillia bacterium]MCL2241375.1 S41 family peptidase [Chitinispirillia bacterium]
MKYPFVLILAGAATLLLSCFYDVYDDDDALAVEERHSVWQWLSVYSIYQGRVPASPGSLSPYDMFDMISDSLYGGRYTEYMDDRPGGGVIPPGEYIDTPITISRNTLYVYVPDFSDESLSSFQAFTGYMEEFDNLVIDLRDNGGGYLSAAHRMTSEFLPYGTEYIQYHRRTYNSDNLRGYTTDERPRSDNARPRLQNKNIAVLINGWSASASEIMAAALKDKAGAYLIGSKSYGKAIGQVVISRPGRKTLSITHMEISGLTERTGRYHKTGLEPDGVPEEIYSEMDSVAILWAAVHCSGNQICNDFVREELRDIYCGVKMLDPEYSPPVPPDTGLMKKTGVRLPPEVARAAALAEKRARPEKRMPIGAIEMVSEL